MFFIIVSFSFFNLHDHWQVYQSHVAQAAGNTNNNNNNNKNNNKEKDIDEASKKLKDYLSQVAGGDAVIFVAKL